MIELLIQDTKPTQPPDILPKVKHWDKTPDVVIREASLATVRQCQKPKRILDPENLHESEGIYMLPRWKKYSVLKLGQRRGISDLVPRGSSAHNVSFGTAQCRTPDNSSVSTIRIAVKTFDQSRKALEDAATNAIVLDRGFSTTDPICVIINQRKGFVITPVKEGVQPLDTEPWHQFHTGSIDVRNHFLTRLRQVSFLLADLHVQGINHSDAQIKNFWVTAEGKIEMFDWESANIFPDPPTAENLLISALDDLRTLFKSLTNQYKDTPISVFIGPDISRWEQFDYAILQHYSDKLIENLEKSGNLNSQLFETIIFIKEELKRQLKI